MYTVLMGFTPLIVAVGFLIYAILFAKEESGE
jgi:hypothetical protein